LIIIGNSLPAFGVLFRAVRASRTTKDLHPLGVSLTTGVPGIVLNTGLRHNPRLRLHRTVIEIRDATLVLSSYGSGTDLGDPSLSVTMLFDCEGTGTRETAYALSTCEQK
jgi:hypothetical protein